MKIKNKFIPPRPENPGFQAGDEAQSPGLRKETPAFMPGSFILLTICVLSVFYCACNKTDKKPQHENDVQPALAAQDMQESPQKIQTGTADSNKKPDTSEIMVTFIELGSLKCIPCKMMQPIMEEIEKEYGDQVKVVFYDVWTEEGKPYAQKYRISAIPTQVFLDKDGNEYYRHTGFFPKEELVKILQMKGVK